MTYLINFTHQFKSTKRTIYLIKNQSAFILSRSKKNSMKFVNEAHFLLK